MLTPLDRRGKDKNMGRIETAYLLIALLAAALIAIVYFTRRYQRYHNAVRHGRRPEKPVWKPFWLA